jgi:quinol monooxygenase YgiN
MDEIRIKQFFLQQIQALIERSAAEREGFLSYFAGRDPRDEEILGLIAISTLLNGKNHLSDRFPSPAEALASLSFDARMDICRAFRDQIKTPHQRQMTAA